MGGYTGGSLCQDHTIEQTTAHLSWAELVIGGTSYQSNEAELCLLATNPITSASVEYYSDWGNDIHRHCGTTTIDTEIFLTVGHCVCGPHNMREGGGGWLVNI